MAEDRCHFGISPCGLESRCCLHGLRRPKNVPHKRNGINPEVQKSTAAKLEGIQSVLGIVGQVLRMVGYHSPNITQRTGGDDLTDSDHMRQEARPHGFQCKQPLSFSHVRDLLGFRSVDREWLFDQHMFPGLECRDRVSCVERVRGRDVDNIYFWIRKKRFIAAMSLGDSELCGKAIGGLTRAGAYCPDCMTESQEISCE